MENTKIVSLPITLKGGENYLLWSRTAKTVLYGRGLWNQFEPPETFPPEAEALVESTEKKMQEDQAVLAILESLLDISVLEAYFYCEHAKELWDTLKNVFGNITNLNRVFEIKRSLNSLSQEEMEFTKFFGKFRALSAELEMLRPPTLEASVLNERREQEKVFALLSILNPAYSNLIKHILRATKLLTLDEVCSQIQKEEGSLGLFGSGKGGELVMFTGLTFGVPMRNNKIAKRVQKIKDNPPVYRTTYLGKHTCAFAVYTNNDDDPYDSKIIHFDRCDHVLSGSVTAQLASINHQAITMEAKATDQNQECEDHEFLVDDDKFWAYEFTPLPSGDLMFFYSFAAFD